MFPPLIVATVGIALLAIGLLIWRDGTRQWDRRYDPDGRLRVTLNGQIVPSWPAYRIDRFLTTGRALVIAGLVLTVGGFAVLVVVGLNR